MKQPLLALSRSLFCKHKPTTFLSASNGTSTRLYSGTGGHKWNDPENEKLTPEEERKYQESYARYNQRRLVKSPKDKTDEEFLDPRNDPDYRLKRIKQLLKEEAKNTWAKFQDPLGEYQKGSLFPAHVDVLIIGGAAMGSSIAHFIKKRTLEGLRVAVVDRDLTVNYNLEEYARASTCLSAGGLRQQFSLKENIEMSLFGADFLRNIQYECYVPGEDDPTVNFCPHGYLYCATDKGAAILEENHALQTSLGAKNVLLTPEKIKQQFPWMNTDGIALACHGLEKEGWFDPWLFLNAVKRKAMSMGAEYVRGEVVKFLIKENPLCESFGFEAGKALTCNEAVVCIEPPSVRREQIIARLGKMSGGRD